MSFLHFGCWRQLLMSRCAVGVLVNDREVVVDVAVLRAGEHLRPPMPMASYRILVLHHPGAHVEEVDVLLDVEVAREPGEVVPVAHLVGHVGPVGLARLGPAAAAVVVGLERDRRRRSRRHECAAPFRGSSCRSAGTAPRRSTGSSSWPPRRSRARSARRAHRRRHGFSAKTCLPASTAAFRCSGRKCGGVVSSTTSHRSITSL